VGTRICHRHICRYVIIITSLDYIFKILQAFLWRLNIKHTYAALLFRKVAYMRYDVPWFVQWMDLTSRLCSIAGFFETNFQAADKCKFLDLLIYYQCLKEDPLPKSLTVWTVFLSPYSVTQKCKHCLLEQPKWFTVRQVALTSHVHRYIARDSLWQDSHLCSVHRCVYLTTLSQLRVYSVQIIGW
jgi:hypothetical protein